MGYIYIIYIYHGNIKLSLIKNSIPNFSVVFCSNRTNLSSVYQTKIMNLLLLPNYGIRILL